MGQGALLDGVCLLVEVLEERAQCAASVRTRVAGRSDGSSPQHHVVIDVDQLPLLLAQVYEFIQHVLPGRKGGGGANRECSGRLLDSIRQGVLHTKTKTCGS